MNIQSLRRSLPVNIRLEDPTKIFSCFLQAHVCRSLCRVTFSSSLKRLNISTQQLIQYVLRVEGTFMIFRAEVDRLAPLFGMGMLSRVDNKALTGYFRVLQMRPSFNIMNENPSNKKHVHGVGGLGGSDTKINFSSQGTYSTILS